jgi:hypothetical protein
MAGMKPINIETLLNHSTGISDSYYRATEKELLTDYLVAVDHLTINEENRLNKKIIELEKQRDQISLLKIKHERDMNELREITDKKLSRILSIIQANPKLVNAKTEILTNI